MFMASLICNMDVDCEKLLVCKMDLDCVKTLHFDTEVFLDSKFFFVFILEGGILDMFHDAIQNIL
jgi:hypothetical protein